MNQFERIFITGFLGSDKDRLAREIASRYHWEVLYLDKEIEDKDGRSIQRICMTMGEHEYRNKECEMLEVLCSKKNAVIVCGDGVVLDDRNVKILKGQKVYIADLALPMEQLWERVKESENAPYAFLLSADENEKYEKFCQLYKARKHLYEQFV